MLKLALLFFLISLVAGILGFTGIATVSAGIAKVIFFVALAGFLIFSILALILGKKVVDETT